MSLWFLDRKLNGIPWLEWSLPILGLAVASVVAGGGSWLAFRGMENLWGNASLLLQIIELGLSGLLGLGIFAILALQLRLPEVDGAISQLKQKILRR